MGIEHQPIISSKSCTSMLQLSNYGETKAEGSREGCTADRDVWRNVKASAEVLTADRVYCCDRAKLSAASTAGSWAIVGWSVKPHFSASPCGGP